MALFIWDEISCDITTASRKEIDEINEEGGWEKTATYSNGVTRLETDRHVALEVEADSIEDAQQLFLVDPTYRDFVS